jgi:hypothetical protein
VIFAIPCILFLFFILNLRNKSFDHSWRTKATNNATAVNGFSNMHCLAKANNHIVYAMNDFPDLDFPSLQGIAFTDVEKELITAICSISPLFVPTFF